MPRNIAEYIQASSRVARSVKGLVLTLHNPFRSRDVSHFERFREFHEKLYYYVEPNFDYSVLEEIGAEISSFVYGFNYPTFDA